MKKTALILTAVLVLSAFFAGCSKEVVVIESAKDLEGKKIGVQAGTTGEIYVQENVPGAKVYSFKSGIDAALDLKNGSIDAVVLDELPAKEIVANNPDLVIVTDKFAREEYAIAIKKGNTELVEAINSTINTMKENGEYEALVAAFMPADGEITIPEITPVASDKVLKLGTNAAFPPFEYVEGNKVVGFDIVDMSFDSLIPALSSGAIDFIAAGMSVTEERKQNVDFSVPYYESEQVIIIRK